MRKSSKRIAAVLACCMMLSVTSCGSGIEFIDETGGEHLFTGTWKGQIAYKEEGTNGFGYDSIFISEDGNGKTTASMPLSFKETHSHRAKAVKKLMAYLHKM